jgi:hypothetical protein
MAHERVRTRGDQAAFGNGPAVLDIAADFDVADIPIGTLGRGASITIEMLTFKDVQSGTANNVNMIGVPMEITINEGLSSESIIRFTPF